MATLDVIQEFRDDHRKVRDALLSLSTALQNKRVLEAREILGNINVAVGPHFRFEEEHLYPALKPFLGEYIDDLIREHDGAIATAKACVDLLSTDELNDQQAADGARAARSLLIHVSNCDGLAILSERLTQGDLDELGDRLAASREAGVSLLDWADTIRAAGAA